MLRAKEEKITNEGTRRRFDRMEKIEEAWRARQSLLAGHVPRMGDDKHPPIIVASTAGKKRNRGRPFSDAKDNFADNARHMIPQSSAAGSAHE